VYYLRCGKLQHVRREIDYEIESMLSNVGLQNRVMRAIVCVRGRELRRVFRMTIMNIQKEYSMQ